MFTSDTDRNLKTSLIYMIVSIFLAAGGAIYEQFSFGVYSYYMIYAFAIPLIGGALPFMLNKTGRKLYAVISNKWYHAAITTLTIGSIVHGALSICGRQNTLVIVYPAVAAILMAGVMIRAAVSKTPEAIGKS